MLDIPNASNDDFFLFHKKLSAPSNGGSLLINNDAPEKIMPSNNLNRSKETRGPYFDAHYLFLNVNVLGALKTHQNDDLKSFLCNRVPKDASPASISNKSPMRNTSSSILLTMTDVIFLITKTFFAIKSLVTTVIEDYKLSRTGH